MSTVPDKVMQLTKAQMLHDRRQNEARSAMTAEEREKTPKTDYLVPIIADGDAGFGGITTIMKMTKLFIESGAGGMHMEDQKPGVKKCGHLGGKVLVSAREMNTRLQAARLQADILGNDLVIVARTDALSAVFIDNNIDPLDHPFILGAVDPENPEKLMTFPEVGKEAIEKKFTGEEKEHKLKMWEERCLDLSLEEAHKFAFELGFEFNFNWDICRTEEGYFRVKGSVPYCIQRGKAFSPYSDLLWMETDSPRLDVADEFAKGVHAELPNAMLGYNLSPSFNWAACEMGHGELANFVPDLGEMGYNWQFITLAGFHQAALMSELFTKQYVKNGMQGYLDMIQGPEADHGVEQLLHQTWSGANLKDREVELASGGKSSTQANTAAGGSTEKQFGKK
ncbi:MAG: hypothetical protein GY696_01195 [Gammaproteobacteria bacterium]|nr:hypothetical protein [Gammaproteobacteria bacterium]